MFMLDVTQAIALNDHRLDLTFEDGLRAVVDMNAIIKEYKGVFTPLLDEAYFQQVKVNSELGTIVWPNGADICPDVLYSAASGKPIINRKAELKKTSQV